MTRNQYHEIERLRLYLKRNAKLTRREVALEMKIAPETVSKVLNGNYNARDFESITAKIKKYLDKREKELTDLTFQALKEFMDKHPQITQSKIAHETDLSRAVISQFIKEKYRGDLSNVRDRIDAYLRREEEREKYEVRGIEFVHNNITNRIQNRLKFAHACSKMTVIIGPSGSGKSAAAIDYALRDQSVIYIQIDPYTNASKLFEEICKKLNLSSTGSVKEKMGRIEDKLKNSKRLLIVDESQFLPVKTIETLRCLWDRTKIGLAFIGMERLYTQMFGRVMNEYAQILSRVEAPLQIENDLDEKDIIRVVKGQLPDIDAKSLKLLINIGNKDGKLRRVTSIIANARLLAKQKNENKITYKQVKISAGFLLEAVS